MLSYRINVSENGRHFFRTDWYQCMRCEAIVWGKKIQEAFHQCHVEMVCRDDVMTSVSLEEKAG